MITFISNYFFPQVCHSLAIFPVLLKSEYRKLTWAKVALDFFIGKFLDARCSRIEGLNICLCKFALKYLAKFICEHPIESIAINGGAMPIMSIAICPASCLYFLNKLLGGCLYEVLTHYSLSQVRFVNQLKLPS